MRHKENHPDTSKSLTLIQKLKHKGLLQKEIAKYLKVSEFTMIKWNDPPENVRVTVEQTNNLKEII